MMKILWIVNNILPDVAKALNIRHGVSGGWLYDLSQRIAEYDEVELAVATYYSGTQFQDIRVGNIRYFLLPGGSRKMMFYSKEIEQHWHTVEQAFPADIVHLHGTEYVHGLAYLNAFPHKRSVLTIQGIITRIAEEFFGGLSWADCLRYRTLSENIKFNGIFENHVLLKRNAGYEQQIIRRVKYATGRTCWDKTVMQSINPALTYFRCNYNLRPEFYDAKKWEITDAEPHAIFTGQAFSPLKGLHQLLRAVGMLRPRYPDIRLYVPGGKVVDGALVTQSGYVAYIRDIIARYQLTDNVVFLGDLHAERIIDHMRRARVVVVPSAMEGASATLCEAMFLGVPCVAAFRGGMTELLRDKISGFYYDYPEYPFLAERIAELFDTDDLARQFSREVQPDAARRHDREKNPQDMMNVYRVIAAHNDRQEGATLCPYI